MSRKRQRDNEGAATVPPPPPPPPPGSSYFCYTSAPEQEDERRRDAATTAPNEPRFLRPTLDRGHHQREVDKVDIPAPAEWLCHDAAASTKLRDQAQTELQLFVARRPTHLPHSERQELHVRDRDAGLVAAIKSTVGSWAGPAIPRERRPGRVLCGGEVLPWGVWPARLRHHEGQSFYRQESDVFGDGGGVGRSNYLVGGGSVGRVGGVGGVGSVSEGSIHDEMLRRRFPSSSASDSSTYQRQHQHAEETAVVTRLLPDKRGRWAEVKTKTEPPRAAALPSPLLETPANEPAPAATESGEVVKCLIPGRYGGWFELEEKVADRARNSTEQRQRRRTTATRTARFRPDTGGGVGVGGGVPDAALPSSYIEEERYVRRMLAEAAVAATATAAREEAQQRRREGNSQQQEQDQEQEHSARVGTEVDDTNGQCGGGGSGDGGASWRSGGSTEGAEGTRRKDNGDIVADGGGFGKGRTDDGRSDDDGQSRGCSGRGWTVSEPAKETVRRVWNRARRRARDSSEPRHRASRASDDDHGDIPAAAGGVAIRDDLDAGLLSCLGRECEGIIDAALHVVLGDRLRLLRQQSSAPISSPTQEEKQNSKPPPPPPPPPPPLETADWQDVLRAMRNCSDGARGVRATAAVTTVAGQRDGDRQPTPLGATTGRGGGERRTSGAGVEHEGGRGERGGEGVLGRGEMERTVWGAGDSSDGSVVVVNERLPGLPLNEAVLTRAYNRLLIYLHEKKTWHA